jgi:hypothetical protein
MTRRVSEILVDIVVCLTTGLAMFFPATVLLELSGHMPGV